MYDLENPNNKSNHSKPKLSFRQDLKILRLVEIVDRLLECIACTSMTSSTIFVFVFSTII